MFKVLVLSCKIFLCFFNIISAQSNHTILDGARDSLKEHDTLNAFILYNYVIDDNRYLPQAYYERGVLKKNLKFYFDASRDLNYAIELDSTKKEYFAMRGLVKHYLDKFPEAIADYNKALEFDPANDTTYFFRGCAKDNLEDFKGSIEDYNIAIKINPTRTNYFFNRATAKSNLKDIKGAIEDYSSVIKLDSNYALAYSRRSLLRAYQGNNIEEAMNDCNKAISLDSTESDLYSNRGMLFDMLGDNKSAIFDFNKAIELDSNNAIAIGERGNAKLNMNDLDGAAKDHTLASKLMREGIRGSIDVEAKLKKYSILQESDLDNPLAFIERASKISNDSFPYPIGIPAEGYPINWVKEKDIEELIKLVRSEKKCMCYMSPLSSHFPDKNKANVGGYAIMFVQSFRSKSKIDFLLDGCPVTTENLAQEIIEWWNLYKTTIKPKK
jgi:tetratricopeptide (TPR) repeat protein